MKRVIIAGACALSVAIAALGAVAAPSAGAAAPASAAPVPVEWTYAFYDNCDNDLMYCWPQFTRRFLARLPANSQVHIVLMLDRPRGTGTTLYELGGGTVTKVATFPEKDFGSGVTFEWFIKLIHDRYPSNKLGVGVIDHGYGWRYFSRDYTSNWDGVTMPEMQNAIVGAAVPIDVLSFDCCNMADVAVLYQASLTHLVKYVVASEEEIEQDGYPYDVQLTALANDPSLTPQEVAVDMVDGFARYNLPLQCFNFCSLGAIDVAKIGAAKPDLQAWVARLRLDLPIFRARYDADRADCIYAWQSWQVDLSEFCDKLVADPLITDPVLKTLSARVSADCKGAMLNLWSGSYSAPFQGLTIWWGTGGEWSWYRRAFERQVAFGRPEPLGADWYAFLKAYNAMEAGGDGVTPAPPASRSRTAGEPARPDSPLAASPRWPASTVHPDKYGLTDVTFLDTRHGWAVGYNDVWANAVILRTTDGGAHWKARSPFSWYAFEFGAVTALDIFHLWVVGSERWSDSAVAGSANGGATWRMKPSHTYEYLMSVDFADARHGWVCGTNGALLHTTDGGAHWMKAPAWSGSENQDLWAVDFTDVRHGWIAGGSAATMTGFIRRTSDGGQTWTLQHTVTGAVFYGLKAPVCAVGGDPVTGNGAAVCSTDGGATWAPSVGIPSDRCLYGLGASPTGKLWLTGSKGLVMSSADGGAGWSACGATPVARDLTAASFTSDTNGWVVGDCKEILHTTDGGATWSSLVADVTGPCTRVLHEVVVRQGHKATIDYRVNDDMSATANVTIEITGHGRTRTLHPGRQTTGTPLAATFVCNLPAGAYTCRVYAIDESGNHAWRVVKNRLVVK